MDRTPKKVLEDKKKKFLLEVDKASDNLGVQVKEVKFWKEYDKDHFYRGERAHIHIEEGKICIAEPQLREMSNEDIIETAHHEVSHLKHVDHDIAFHSTLEDSKTSSWEPPQGTFHVYGGSSSRNSSNDKKTKEKRRDECSECSKRKDITNCKYCGRPFCKEHLNPRIPFIGTFTRMERDETPNSHPCFQYGEFKEKERAVEEETYARNLDLLLSNKRNVRNEKRNVRNEKIVYIDEPKKEHYSEQVNSKRQQIKEEEYVEMYNPHKRDKSYSSPKRQFNLSLNFLKFSIPSDIKDSFIGLLIATAVGLFFDYIYYQSLSLNLLFITGISEWFGVLQQTLNYGLIFDYNLVYLIINGIFYFYLYSMAIKFIISLVSNLDDLDTWKMIAWIAFIVFAVSKWVLPLF